MTRARDVANLIGSGNYSSTTFTATAGQTAFTISHTQGFIQVFMNGLLLDETADYTSNGSAVTLTSGAAAGDEIEVVAYNTFSVGDALNQAAADTRYVNTTGDTMTGNLLLSSGSVGVGTTSPLRQLHISNSGNSEIAFTAGTSGFSSILFGDGLTGTDVYKGYLQYNHAQDKMLMATAAGSSIEIDSAGRVTTPYQPLFVGYLSSNVSPNTSVSSPGNAISLTTIQNVGNHWNTNTFTCPVAGRYLCSSFHIKYPVSGASHVDLYKNGSGVSAARWRGEETGTYVQVGGSTIVVCSANDTLQWKYFGSAGLHDGNGNWSITLLG